MRIAVIGSGNVGGTLGRRWATLGHDVVFGVRDPKRGAAAVKGGAGEGALPDRARVATPAQAVRGDDGWRADVVLVATPWPAVASALSELGPGALDGVVLLDATNPDPGRAVVWSHPAFANRSIYARNDRELVCASLAQP